ncbi:MAG: DUF58 domain-containing protein [Acidobacteria bacterium]|nr:DUF58 domain-containing protein [Acidobacteriota bacterium]
MKQKAFLDPEVLAGIKNLVVRARTVVEGALVGEHVSPFRGGSIEFAQHRPYTPGDELRYIDWRLLARTDQLHVKQFEVTTNLRAYLLVDASGSMAYPESASLSKYSYASLLASALAYVLIQQSDAVSLCTNEPDGVRYLPPRSQIAYLKQILSLLDQHAPQGEEGVMALVRHVQDRVSHRSLIILMSDFFVDLDQLNQRIKYLRGRGHDLMVFQVIHPDEVAFPFQRFYEFHCMETPETLTADGRSIRDHYLEAFQEHQDKLKDIMRQAGVDFTSVTTDQPPDRVLARHLNQPHRAQKLRKMY